MNTVYRKELPIICYLLISKIVLRVFKCKYNDFIILSNT